MPVPSLIVHGGAGAVPREGIEAYRAGCEAAARLGQTVLAGDGPALDAVERAVVALEDDPTFNAGTGSAPNADGEVEADAAIMDGSTLRAGAVAALRGFANPVRVARAILDDARHVLLCADGAARFARDAGLEACALEALLTERQRERWRREHGTVGCVACDARGRLAAATSTGGVFDQRPGRVGDTPVIGAGTYADGIAAVSCTGHGEAILRTVLARFAAERVAAGLDPQAAADAACAELARSTGGVGGLIVIDRDGRIGHARNAACMPVCRVGADGLPYTEA